MKIEKPLFTFSDCFNLKFIVDAMNQNKIPITEHGGIVSFVCPTSIPINGSNVTGKSVMNVCYLLPSATAAEIAYFQLLFAGQLAAAINTAAPNEHILSSSTMLVKNSNLCGISLVGLQNGCGFGWHTAFLSDFQTTGEVSLEHISLPDPQEGQPTPEDTIHSNIQSAFDAIRKHIATQKINLALEK